MAEKTIKGFERKFLDNYAFAQLGITAPGKQIDAMGEMYHSFMGEYDPIVEKTLQEAQMAKQHMLAKQQYDATPEEQKGEAQDPGQVNEYLAKSAQVVSDAATTYTQKRMKMLSEFTCPQVLDYLSDKDDKPLVRLPEELREAIVSNTQKLGELTDTEEDEHLGEALMAMDHFKVHGITNLRLERSLAEQKLARTANNLEQMSQSE